MSSSPTNVIQTNQTFWFCFRDASATCGHTKYEPQRRGLYDLTLRATSNLTGFIWRFLLLAVLYTCQYNMHHAVALAIDHKQWACGFQSEKKTPVLQCCRPNSSKMGVYMFPVPERCRVGSVTGSFANAQEAGHIGEAIMDFGTDTGWGGIVSSAGI